MKAGDRVSLPDEDFRGKVVRVQGGHAVVEDEFGFQHTFPVHCLILQDQELYAQVPVRPKAEPIPKKSRKTKGSAQRLDLHFERLVSNPQDYSPELRLWMQREKLLEKIEWCRTNFIPELVIIHGIGDGILQQMVHDTLAGLAGIEVQTSEILHHQSGSVRVFFR